ncbi:MAG: archaeal proteasome endopeptidase complex subunit beta [Candidatus Aenigmatarchaeota archaeon]
MLEKTDLRKTGTTTVGVVAKDAVILGAERKSTMGYLVASKDAMKITKVDDRIGMTIAGMVGDAQALEKIMKAELKLYMLQEEKPASVKAAANLMASILYSRRFYPYIVQLLVGGYDTAPRLYSFDPSGSIQEENKYFSTGSGSPMALGVLEDKFRDGMPLEEAMTMVARAIYAATQRDIASGGSGIDIAVMDKKGFRQIPNEEVKAMLKK